jgi:hypothetical protein
MQTNNIIKTVKKKNSVLPENRSIELQRYYDKYRTKLLKKVKCECGRFVSKNRLELHTYTSLHHRTLKSKRIG